MTETYMDLAGWDRPLLESLSQKHKELHDDWAIQPAENRKIFIPRKLNHNGWSIAPWTEYFKRSFHEVAKTHGLACRSTLEDKEYLWDAFPRRGTGGG